MKTTPQLSGVAEDWMLLGGAVLYGFTRGKGQPSLTAPPER